MHSHLIWKRIPNLFQLLTIKLIVLRAKNLLLNKLIVALINYPFNLFLKYLHSLFLFLFEVFFHEYFSTLTSSSSFSFFLIWLALHLSNFDLLLSFMRLLSLQLWLLKNRLRIMWQSLHILLSLMLMMRLYLDLRNDDMLDIL